MTRWFAALVVILAAVPAAADIQGCSNRADPAAQIAACTAVIDAGNALPPDLGLAHLYRCQAHDMNQRYADALPDCERAAGILTRDPAAHNSLAIVLLNLDRPAEALDPATRAVTLLPTHGSVYNVRADVHCRLGNTDAAVADRLDALQHGRYTAENLQEFLKIRGHYQGAIDGAFGKGSRAALRAWTDAGCQ
ncbi:MAG: peptidoglycan-binding domain-containing protein [Pseudomonadota bacterium]